MPETATENKKLQTVSPIKVEEDYSVTVVNKASLLSFFKDGANLDGLYNVVQAKARALVADVTTADGVSKIKSTARQIASIKKRVDDLGKDVVAELKDLPKQIDANRKKWREDMEALQEEIRKPVTEIENRQAEIEEIRATHGKLALSGSEEIKAAIEMLDKIELTGDKWKESLEDATAAVTAEKGALEVMLNAALKKEAEARELEELRKKQEEAERIIRENKIKEEAECKAREEAEARAAAEKARLEREKAEAERKAAEAERARQEAEERARREAMQREQERAQAQARMAQEPAPAAPAAPAQKPSKWTPEMKAVNNDIVKAIAAIIAERLQGFTVGGYEVAAREIVKAIVNNKINHLSVRY